MDIEAAVESLSALAQDRRLAAFRLLVQAGPAGLPAGDIAQALDIPHNTLSTHLAVLTRAGLLSSQRDGRSITYRVDLAGTRSLLAYLLEDCCQGAENVCQPALDTLFGQCCTPHQKGAGAS